MAAAVFLSWHVPPRYLKLPEVGSVPAGANWGPRTAVTEKSPERPGTQLEHSWSRQFLPPVVPPSAFMCHRPSPTICDQRVTWATSNLSKELAGAGEEWQKTRPAGHEERHAKESTGLTMRTRWSSDPKRWQQQTDGCREAPTSRAQGELTRPPPDHVRTTRLCLLTPSTRRQRHHYQTWHGLPERNYGNTACINSMFSTLHQRPLVTYVIHPEWV